MPFEGLFPSLQDRIRPDDLKGTATATFSLWFSLTLSLHLTASEECGLHLNLAFIPSSCESVQVTLNSESSVSSSVKWIPIGLFAPLFFLTPLNRAYQRATE